MQKSRIRTELPVNNFRQDRFVDLINEAGLRGIKKLHVLRIERLRFFCILNSTIDDSILAQNHCQSTF